MKVHGFEPTEAQLNKAIEYMKSSSSFGVKNVENLLIAEGVPKYEKYNFIAMRVADRLIQKLRKQGKIETRYRALWNWVEN